MFSCLIKNASNYVNLYFHENRNQCDHQLSLRTSYICLFSIWWHHSWIFKEIMSGNSLLLKIVYSAQNIQTSLSIEHLCNKCLRYHSRNIFFTSYIWLIFIWWQHSWILKEMSYTVYCHSISSYHIWLISIWWQHSWILKRGHTLYTVILYLHTISGWFLSGGSTREYLKRCHTLYTVILYLHTISGWFYLVAALMNI